MSSNNKLKVFTNGFLKENPVLVLVLGTCPTLATSTMASNGIGMGLAATFVLVCSNIVISALRKIIPNQVRRCVSPATSPSSPASCRWCRCWSRPLCPRWTRLWACTCP